MTPEEIVQKQLDTYNACDIDGFAATYTEDVVIVDHTGKTICEGVKQLREIYGPLFDANPNQVAVITKRIVAGDYVMDDEEVIGRADSVRRYAGVVYRVTDGLISHVTMLRKDGPETPRFVG